MVKDSSSGRRVQLRSRGTPHGPCLQFAAVAAQVEICHVKGRRFRIGSAFALADDDDSFGPHRSNAGLMTRCRAASAANGGCHGYCRVIPAFREHHPLRLAVDRKRCTGGELLRPLLLADTRSFCRYMADQIDRVLMIEYTEKSGL